MITNFWGEPILSPRELLQQDELKDAFQIGASRIFAKFGLNVKAANALIEEIWILAGNTTSGKFESDMQAVIANAFDDQLIRTLLDERAAKVTKQISPYVTGKSLLDVGAGDGMVSWLLREQVKEVLLVDVVNYVDPRVEFPFLAYPDGQSIPTTELFETVLLINVLHHSDFPVQLLEDAWNRTKDRLVIIESVYGDESRIGHGQPPFSLDLRSQFLYTSFFDWFYNRVLHSAVPVPFNFAAPSIWLDYFKRRDMTLEHKTDLGIDIDIVPIHHYLFVLRK